MTARIILSEATVSAGFPSPADDFSERKLDLNEYLIKHPAATFFVRAKGVSMQNGGISDGDLLIVDRALEARSGNIIIGFIDGEFTVKRIRISQKQVFLIPENSSFKPIRITEEMDFQVWGVVTFVIKRLSAVRNQLTAVSDLLTTGRI
ncbi:MAG: translesion error-prone DNA polymerase V autoproteolytic subunit [Patescibacteria group bacterium]|nr:translesion error-prone DNA polymerase V autoproteolytic subunit [Patescibacteria group bacterium]